MADLGDDDLDALRSDPTDFSGGPLGDPAFTNAELAAELHRAAELAAEVPLTAVAWLHSGDAIAVINANPTPLETRAHAVAEELIEVIYLDGAPEWMDPQVNVGGRDGVLDIEVDVDEDTGPLWAVIDVLGEALGAEFVADPLDRRSRTARLPLAVAQRQQVRLVLQPSA